MSNIKPSVIFYLITESLHSYHFCLFLPPPPIPACPRLWQPFFYSLFLLVWFFFLFFFKFDFFLKKDSTYKWYHTVCLSSLWFILPALQVYSCCYKWHDFLLFSAAVAAAAKSLLSCLTLCDPADGSPPGSSVPGILHARVLEWVAISFSNACKHAKSLQSCLTLCDPMDSSPPVSSVHGIL